MDSALRDRPAWVTLSGMSLENYEFRDPAALIDEVAHRVPLREGTAYVALVAHPSSDQRIVAIERLNAPAVLDHYEDARDELYDTMQRLPIPDTFPLTHATVTIVVRRGLCVLGPSEGHWLSAWRYSNHLTGSFTGDLILVTEHGWTDFMTGHADTSPALVG